MHISHLTPYCIKYAGIYVFFIGNLVCVIDIVLWNCMRYM